MMIRTLFLLALGVFTSSSLADSIVGNPLIDRPDRDGAGGSIFLIPSTSGQGVVDQFGFFDNGFAGRQITPIIMQAVGTGYEITGIGSTFTSDGSGEQTGAFGLTSGSAAFGLGNVLAFKDGSNGANNAGASEFTNGAGLAQWFGAGQTSFSVGQSFPLPQSFGRTYSVQATLTLGPGEIVGNSLVNRGANDGGAGNMFVLNDPFTRTGHIDSWAIFDDDASGSQITPFLFQQNGANWDIVGIGATQTSDGSGAQTFLFDTTSGSDAVGSDIFFGWKDGGNGNNNTGVADFQGIVGGASVTWFGGQTSFSLGNSYAANSTFDRSYSIEAFAIPEASSLTLLLLGSILLLRRFRG
jgi:hypothetical protein